ncbi:MAG: hypothetical protein RBT64_06545 [Trichloromonas sp.]|jgi:hypothetical protein|nr:hypothetical protein [Trichloromonas sp.]
MIAAKWMTVPAIGALLPAGTLALAAEQVQTREETQVREEVYGSQLMSPEERNAYQTRMRAAENGEERERIRAEHHERMKIRAREQGLSLPDEPPAHGMHKGMGSGPGGGMGKGRY